MLCCVVIYLHARFFTGLFFLVKEVQSIIVVLVGTKERLKDN